MVRLIIIVKRVANGKKTLSESTTKLEFITGCISGVVKDDIIRYQELLESTACLFIRFAKDGGFDSKLDQKMLLEQARGAGRNVRRKHNDT